MTGTPVSSTPGASTTATGSAPAGATGPDADTARAVTTALFVHRDLATALRLFDSPDQYQRSNLQMQVAGIRARGDRYVIGTVRETSDDDIVVDMIAQGGDRTAYSYRVMLSMERGKVVTYSSAPFNPDVDPSKPNAPFTCSPSFVTTFRPVAARDKAIAGRAVPNLDVAPLVAEPARGHLGWTLEYRASKTYPQGPTEAMTECFARQVVAHGWTLQDRTLHGAQVGPGKKKLVTSEFEYYRTGQKYRTGEALIVQLRSKDQQVVPGPADIELTYVPNGHLAALPPPI